MRIVNKFGGTSVGDGRRIRAAAGLIAREAVDGREVAVVSSAMSGVTDALIRAARSAAAGQAAAVHETRLALAQQHHAAILEAAQDPEARDSLVAQVDQALEDFETLGRAVAALGEITPRALDAIGAFGERLLVPIMAQALREMGTPAEAVDASELIVTDDRFGAANPDMHATEAATCRRIDPLLRAGTVPVITGFIGATRGGIVTTLGRGGSDYSATILGNALDADEVWIWTDVDGVMSADPRVVPQARTLPEISYAEAAELAYFGAKVLHPKTIQPAVDKGIPIRILNTLNPASPGTRIVRESSAGPQTVKAITAIRHLSLMTVEGRGMIGVPGVAGRVFTTVAREGISVLMISQSSSEQNICFMIESAQAARVAAALEREFALERIQQNIERVLVQDEAAILAVVGAGLRTTPGIAAKVFNALAAARINVLALAQGSSEYNLSLVVQESEADAAVQVIHTSLSPAPSLL